MINTILTRLDVILEIGLGIGLYVLLGALVGDAFWGVAKRISFFFFGKKKDELIFVVFWPIMVIYFVIYGLFAMLYDLASFLKTIKRKK